MKKILGLTVAAMMVMAMVGAGTWAFFNDTETSSANILSAGTLDLTLDGGNDDVQLLTASIGDIYPGDSGNATAVLKNIGSLAGELEIEFSAIANTESTGTTGTSTATGTTTTMIDSALIGGSADDWVGFSLEMTGGTNGNIGQRRLITASDESSGQITVASTFSSATESGDTYALVTEYELDTTNGAGNGELGAAVTMSVYIDVDGSTTWNTGDIELESDGTAVPYSNDSTLDGGTIDSFDSENWDDVYAGTMANGVSDIFRIEWVWAVGTADNTPQGDSLSFDITFTLEDVAAD